MQYKGMLAVAALSLIASQATAADQSKKNRGQEAEKTYCFQYSSDTGSRINKTECRTKKEWALLGVDVDDVVGK